VPSQFSRTTRSLANDTSWWALAAWALGAVLLAAWMTWFALGRVTVYEISRKARLEVQQAPHAVASPLAGRVVGTHLVIGREVQAGDLLVELDASREQLRRREEETRLAAIPPRQQSLRAEVALLEQAAAEDERAAAAALDGARHRAGEAAAAAAFALDNERRLKAESEVGGVARVEALRAVAETQKLVAAREAAAAEVRRLHADALVRARQSQAQIESLRRTLAALENEAATVRAALDRLAEEIDRHRIRAPVAGRVGESTPLRAGAYVAEGQRLATVIPSGELLILADFDPATALGRVHAGQAARMRLEGFPWAQYGSLPARVVRVASELRDGLVRVELAVDPAALPAAFRQHGLPGAVEVSVEQTSPAVLVLRAAGQGLAVGATPAAPAPAERTP